MNCFILISGASIPDESKAALMGTSQNLNVVAIR